MKRFTQQEHSQESISRHELSITRRKKVIARLELKALTDELGESEKQLLAKYKSGVIVGANMISESIARYKNRFGIEYKKRNANNAH